MRAIDPKSLVQALREGSEPPLVQSLAILNTSTRSIPIRGLGGLRERAVCGPWRRCPAMDSHPLIVRGPRLPGEAAWDRRARRNEWLKQWLEEGDRTLGSLLSRSGGCGRFCFGDEVTLADICLRAASHVAKDAL